MRRPHLESGRERPYKQLGQWLSRCGSRQRPRLLFQELELGTKVPEEGEERSVVTTNTAVALTAQGATGLASSPT